MTSNVLFVWVYLPDSIVPTLAGRLTLSSLQGKQVGNFVYGTNYLSRSDARPIDPVSLPLSNKNVLITSLNGLPGVIADSCPDKWGIRVIDRFKGEGKEYSFPVDYLLMNDPGRVGNLAFSRSSKDIPQELYGRQFELRELLQAARDVELNNPVSSELLIALHPGTGGARPKCNIVNSDGVWLAKFPSSADSVISNPRFEHATMLLASRCGIHVAQTKLEVIDGADVCLVKRFDREIVGGQITRNGFLSARSVFYDDPGFAQIGFGSYARLARWLPKYGCEQEDKLELYRRMVFNVSARNSDDHELNHGLVCNSKGAYSLSPAYDIVPSLHSNAIHRHALLIGEDANGTVESLLGNIKAFDLKHDEAVSIIEDIQSKIRENFVEVFYEAGFGDDDIRRIESCFSPIPVDRNSRPLAAAKEVKTSFVQFVEDGAYTGTILDVKNGVVVQKKGIDGDVVHHDATRLSVVPKIDSFVKIQYGKDVQATVTDMSRKKTVIER